MAIEKLNVGIFIFDSVEVLDFTGPYEVFSRTRLSPGLESRRSEETAPFSVFTVAKTGGPVEATGGLRVIPDHNFASVPKIDILVVPGGFGTRALLEDSETLNWIRNISEQARLVTSVCTGALVLARAGLLANKQATTHWGALDLLADLDSSIDVQRDRRIVDDGVVTSAGVAAGIDMSFAVVEKLFGREIADETARYIEFNRNA